MDTESRLMVAKGLREGLLMSMGFLFDENVVELNSDCGTIL